MNEDAFIQSLAEAILAVVKPVEAQTPKQASAAVVKVLKRYAKLYGQSPDIEVSQLAPGHFGPGSGWDACWEAGPYQWGIYASMAISSSGIRLCETHYGFDLMFYAGE